MGARNKANSYQCIDLKEIPVFVTTIKRNTDRHDRIRSMAKRLGLTHLKFVFGPLTTPYAIGIARTHIRGLTQVEPPFLILEDDCVETSAETVIRVPDGTDAVYLGTSLFGKDGDWVSRPWVYRASRFDAHYLRLINMLSIHAILYLSTIWRDRVVENLSRFIQNPQGGCDECLVLEMPNYLLLAVKKPMFYQADGHSELVTQTPLKANYR